LSGFVGILNLDGAPVDRVLLGSMTRSLAFRGPDAEGIWCEGAVGLGHTLLRTTLKAASEAPPNVESDKQPAALGDRLWIVADARIDARSELIGKLKAKSGAASCVSLSTPDAILILHAYGVWGDACVEQMLGDFSFALWDSVKQRLFCARDHMGVKPFYYAQVGSLVIFSNTLDCIRRHPAVSDRLNDQTIADFLLFDTNQDPATTAFAEIRRLPAAHLLECDREAFSIRRYWDLSVTEPVKFKRANEYLECFQELLDQAVGDRLLGNSVGMLMSGGLDSSTVAASAKRLLTKDGSAGTIFAQTLVLDGVIPDDERQYARLTADALKFPIEFRTASDCALFDRADKPEYRSPGPEHTAWPDLTTDLLRQIATKSRVALTGNGSDPGFSSRISAHFKQLLRHGQIVPALGDAVRYLSAEGRFSRLYLHTRWNLLFSFKNPFSSYPSWLNEDLERQLGLSERWKVYGVPDRRTALRRESNAVAFRPEAITLISHVGWQNLLEGLDPGATQVPVEVRHPFFDLRLLTFLLGLPRLPWCCDKELLRQSGRGVLPDSVRLRGKSPLDADPTVALLEKPESAWVDRFEAVPELERYVRRDRIPPVHGEKRPGVTWVNLRPLSLNFWLRGQARIQYKDDGTGRI
jgi:asparagine synthase (glutamine-hydrolysing)